MDTRERERIRAKDVKQYQETQQKVREQKVREAREPLQLAKESTVLTRVGVAIAIWSLVLTLFVSLMAYRLSHIANELALGSGKHDSEWRAEQRQIAAEQLQLLTDIRDRLPPAGVSDGQSR